MGHDAVFPEIGSHAINIDYHKWYGWPQLYYIITSIQSTNLACTLTHSALSVFCYTNYCFQLLVHV